MTVAHKFLQENSDSGMSEVEKFRSLALRYQAIGAKEGIKIIPFESPDLPHFQKATPEEKKAAIDFLEVIVNIHEETLAHGEKVSNSKKLLWRALNRFSLVPPSDLFEKFEDKDIIVIYNNDQKVIFWSIQFFNFLSFTVEQLFTIHWYKFTERTPENQAYLYQMAMDVIQGKIKEPFNPHIPPHEVQELNTLENLRTMMDIFLCSPLTRKGQLEGILIGKRMQII